MLWSFIMIRESIKSSKQNAEIEHFISSFNLWNIWTAQGRTTGARLLVKWNGLRKRGEGAKAHPEGPRRTALAPVLEKTVILSGSRKHHGFPRNLFWSWLPYYFGYLYQHHRFYTLQMKRHNILGLLFRDIKFLVHIIITHEICKCLPSKKSELPATQGERGDLLFPLSKISWQERQRGKRPDASSLTRACPCRGWRKSTAPHGDYSHWGSSTLLCVQPSQ